MRRGRRRVPDKPGKRPKSRVFYSWSELEGGVMARIGINGFGRIGRQVLRAIREQHPDELQVVGVNDLADVKTNAHLFKYDSNYGIFPGTVKAGEGSINIDGDDVRVFSERDPGKIPWRD